MNDVGYRTRIRAALVVTITGIAVSTSAAEHIEGRVEAGGGPIVDASVALWVTTPGDPRKLAETQTSDDGSFDLSTAGDDADAGVHYLIARGGVAKAGDGTGPNPAITGVFHFCVQDPDVEGLAARIVENGGKQRMPVREYFPGEKPYRMVYCEDPFGNLIEIYSHSYELTYSAGAYQGEGG